jgi:hypothetical protein
LLSCSESEVQSSLGADLVLAKEVDVGDTFDAITREVEPDGYSTKERATSHGPRLVVTGPSNDQYFVSILNDTKHVQISSFSRCFEGALTDD